MKMIRLYSGDDGQSHFEDVEITLNKNEVGSFGLPIKTDELTFAIAEAEGISKLSWHTTDVPTYIVILEGAMELEVGDGTKRTIKAGDILLAEDLTGQGHLTHAINNQNWRFLMLTAAKSNPD
ncbi:MAG: hypothetical protein AAGA27_04620 [Pseudomonadota bacterium]